MAIWELDDAAAMYDLLDERVDVAAADEFACDEVDDVLAPSILDAGVTVVSADADDEVETDEVDSVVVCADGVTCCGACSGEQPDSTINTKQVVAVC